MVVSHALERRRRRGIRLSAAAVVVVFAASPIDAWPRPSLADGSPVPTSPPSLRSAQNRDYDPAAATFFSLLSFGAMRMIAPAIFGDFQSPAALSYAPQASGVMLQGAGFDAAVSTMLNGFVQQDLLPKGGALVAAEFGIDASPDSASEGDVASGSMRSLSLSVDIATPTGDVRNATIEGGGIEPVCAADEIARKLQAGGEYWNRAEASVGGAGLAPAQFPLGVFVRPVRFESLSSDLGPTGDRANLAAPGPAGAWCRPGREPFSWSSPLENNLLWIAFSIIAGAVLVAWLSRGSRLPAI